MDMGNSKRTEKLRRQYRNILRRFSNAGNYDGYFIGKVSLEFNMAADSGKMSENQAHIIKSRENYAELAAMDIAASKRHPVHILGIHDLDQVFTAHVIQLFFCKKRFHLFSPGCHVI